MTRKRFCKKLMAVGADRNTAARLASMVGPGRSYEKEYPWAANKACFGSFGISPKKAERAMMKFAAAARAKLAELDPAIAIALSTTPSRSDKQ